MRTRRTQALLLAATATFLASGVAAQTAPQKPSSTATAALFDKLDVNKDGTIDKEEAKAMRGLSELFDKADVNKDGKLDRAEFDAAIAGPKG